jgi:hypothetical protein
MAKIKITTPPVTDPPTNRPTVSDSLALYNNALLLSKYYNNPKYKKKGSDKDITAEQVTNANQIVNEAVKAGGYKVQVGNKMVKIKPEQYRKEIDENKYYQREKQAGILDLRAPMGLFDKRISPQEEVKLTNEDKKDAFHGDEVSLFKYDPIAVKPWNMLNPEERLLRAKKYPQAQPVASTASAQRPVFIKVKGSSDAAPVKKAAPAYTPPVGHTVGEINGPYGPNGRSIWKGNNLVRYEDLEGNERPASYFGIIDKNEKPNTPDLAQKIMIRIAKK